MNYSEIVLVRNRIMLKPSRLTGRIFEMSISAKNVLRHEFYQGCDVYDHYATDAFDVGPIVFP